MKKDVTQISEDRSSTHIASTPFRRARSRVFYASETASYSSTPNPNLDTRRKSVKRGRGSHTPRPISVISEGTECLVSQVDGSSEHLFTPNDVTDENLIIDARDKGNDRLIPICGAATECFTPLQDPSNGKCSADSSPSGSWRDFVCSPNSSWRCSPSQRSQDSGYSDSGDSSNGVQAEFPDSVTTTQVKHITRVYFGDCRSLGDLQCNSCSQLSVNSKSNINTDRVYKTARRRCYSSVNVAFTNDSNENVLANNVCSDSLKEETNRSKQSLILDDVDIQLEHKSLPTSSTPNPTTKKRTANRFIKHLFSDQRVSRDRKSNSETFLLKFSAFTPKRGSNKSSSQERLIDSCPPPSRPNSSKARRRWSVSGAENPEEASCSGDQNEPLKNLSPSLSLTRLIEEVENDEAIEPSRRLPPPYQVSSQLRNASTTQWLDELKGRCEPECMNTLQSKSLSQELSSTITHSENAISEVQKKAHVVSTEFALLCQKIESLQLDDVPPLVKSLVAYIQNFIRNQCPTNNNNSSEDAYTSSLDHQVRVVDQICSRLVEVCSQLIVECSAKEEPEAEKATDCSILRDFVKIVTALGHAFTKLVDMLLSIGIKSMVTILEDSSSEKEVRLAVMRITSLGVDGGHVCRLVGRAGGIRALLGICVDPRRKRIRPHALRALATVCCVAEGIEYFEKDGGLEVISDVLCDEESPENERSEAAGVLAQITSPWVEDNPRLPCLDGHLESLIYALTEMAETTTSMEALLLCTAALANLTFLDGNCTDIFLRRSTHKILLKKVQLHPNLTIFIKDQIATVLANLSSGHLAAKEVVEADGISVLVNFLNAKPSGSDRLPEIAATERVQQKTAIAISRLSTEQPVAQRILQLGGASRLVRLCKDEKERNFSDAVLVACLAALRKIAAACGYEELRGVDASELVEPRLLDSFLIYSSQQESYV